jgi:hypothetical protein
MIEQRLPIIRDFQGFDPEKMMKGMMKEMASMVIKAFSRRSHGKKQRRKKDKTSLDQNGFIVTKEKKSGVASPDSNLMNESPMNMTSMHQQYINTTFGHFETHPGDCTCDGLAREGRRHQCSFSTCGR